MDTCLGCKELARFDQYRIGLDYNGLRIHVGKSNTQTRIDEIWLEELHLL